MPRSREMDGAWDGEERPTKLVVDLTAKIYAGHIHAGRAYISLKQAMACAATVIGAAQSEETLELIEKAKADPEAALLWIRHTQAAFSEAVDAGRKQQVADWAAALKGGASQ